MRPILDQSIEFLAIDDIGERYVHRNEHEPVLWHISKVVLDELQLVGGQLAVVGLGSRSFPIDVVQHDEVDLAVIECVIGGAKKLA